MRAKQHHQHQQQQSNDVISSPHSAAECDAAPNSHVSNNGRSDDIDTSALSTDDEDEDEDLAMSSDDTGDDSAQQTKNESKHPCSPQTATATTPAVSCDDNDNVDVTPQHETHANDTVVIKQQQQQSWVNNRRRKSSRPQWHYEGTVLDRSQRISTGNHDLEQSSLNYADTNSSQQKAIEDCDVSGKEIAEPATNIDEVHSVLSPRQDFTRLLNGKTELAESPLNTKSELLLVAGSDSWR
jgi:hypothetical protein